MKASLLEEFVESSAEPRSRPSPDACVELDRYCAGCSYNLRTLPVERDPRTGIAIVRCTECGRFQSANDTATALRPWMGKATSVMLVGWMLVIALGYIWIGVAEGAMSYSTLDELTEWSGAQVQRIGNTTIRTYSGRIGTLEAHTDIPYYEWFIGSVLGVSFMMAMVSGVLAVVVFPHWPRVAYFALIAGLPIVVTAVISVAWRFEAPHLVTWAVPYISAHLGAQLLGGVVGVLAGRPLARLTVRIIFPPSVRPRLAYLWLADGKPMPKPVAEKRESIAQ